MPHQSWDEAVTYYQHATEQRPNDPWAHERLASAYFYQGNYAQSAQEFARSLSLSHPQSRVAERYCAWGQAQQLAGEPQAALANYRICRDGLTNETQQVKVAEWIAAIEAVQDSQ